MANFTPVSALAGGVLIGPASVWLPAANGRIAGVSELTALSNLSAEVFVLVGAMIAGGVFARIVSPAGPGA